MPVVDPASSFIVGNAPQGASYAAPLMNFSPLANMAQDYYQGQALQRQQAMATAFPNGVPTNPDGSPNVNAIVNTGAQYGGVNYLTQMLPYLQRQQYIDYLRGNPASGSGYPAQTSDNQPAPMSPSATTSNPSATGPAGIRGPQSTAAPQAGTQANAPPATIQSIAAENGITDSNITRNVAAALGVDPAQPLPLDQATQVRRMMSRTAAATSTGNGGPSQTGAGVPATPASGVSGGPAPAQTNAPETAAPATGIVPNAPYIRPVPNVPVSALTNSPVPPGYRGREADYIQQQEAIADSLDRQAQQGEVLGFNTKAMLDQAQAARARAQTVRDFLAKVGTAQIESSLPTEAEKNLQSGAAAKTEAQKQAIDQGQKELTGIQALARQSEDLKPYTDLSRSLLSDPKTYTGPFGDLSLSANRLKAAAGGDPNAAMLQEALGKVTAQSVLNQINQQRDQLMEAGGSAGRIFAQQVNLVEKAAPQLATTLGGNRFLVEVASRMGDLNVKIRDMAAQYVRTHGYLDPGFDQQVSNYLKANPMFTKEELANPALLGAPTAPAGLATTQDRLAWGQGMGLKNGAPFRAPNGTYMHWNAPAQ